MKSGWRTMVHHRRGGEIGSPRLCNEGTRRKEGEAFTWRPGGGAFPPGARGQISPGSRGGSWQDPQGGPEGGPGVGPQILVGPGNLIKRASPESGSSGMTFQNVEFCMLKCSKTGSKPDWNRISRSFLVRRHEKLPIYRVLRKLQCFLQ